MLVMDLKMNNLLSFYNFHINMSYPKRIVGSVIEDEVLKDYPNFRYKKVNIVMGPNASGKTSLGKMLMNIFDFMDKKQYSTITDCVNDTDREASFSIDFVVNDHTLYRVHTSINKRTGDKYRMEDVRVKVNSVNIGKRDSYETCIKRMEGLDGKADAAYIEELEKIDGLSWMFAYPLDSTEAAERFYTGIEREDIYIDVLNCILKTLDPAIVSIEKIDEVEHAYVVRYKNSSVIIQDGKLIEKNILSSGTRAGIAVAGMVAAMIEGAYGFYYCDEKFSYIHSDIEKTILSIMINKMKKNEQLFFTTHNTNVLDLPLPKHSYTFLKKNMHDDSEPIQCINAASLLKRNTDSLKCAVENDLFSVAPNMELLYQMEEYVGVDNA